MDDELKKKLERMKNPLFEEWKKLQEEFAKMSKLPKSELTRIPIPAIPSDPNLASEFHKRLLKWINEFDKSLDENYEVGVRLVSFGQSVTFHLKSIGYWNPSLILFSGFTENGEPVELIQHVSQISVLLVKVKRKDLLKPKRPIGFTQSPDDEKGET